MSHKISCEALVNKFSKHVVFSVSLLKKREPEAGHT